MLRQSPIAESNKETKRIIGLGYARGLVFQQVILGWCDLVSADCLQPFSNEPTTERPSLPSRLQDLWRSPLDFSVTMPCKIDLPNLRTPGDDSSLIQSHLNDVSPSIGRTR